MAHTLGRLSPPQRWAQSLSALTLTAERPNHSPGTGSLILSGALDRLTVLTDKDEERDHVADVV